MLPTTFLHRSPKGRSLGETFFLFRGSLVLRGVLAGFLFWYALHFPLRVWHHAWVIALVLFVIDGTAGGIEVIWPDRLRIVVASTVVLDGLVGWARLVITLSLMKTDRPSGIWFQEWPRR